MTKMTVEEWRAAVAKKELRARIIKEERATCTDAVAARKLQDEARVVNRLLKQNRRHLAIAEGMAKHSREGWKCSDCGRTDERCGATSKCHRCFAKFCGHAEAAGPGNNVR